MKDNLGRLAVWREETEQWVMYAGVRDMKADELLDPTDEWTELEIVGENTSDGT
jgi:hypothetical protein